MDIRELIEKVSPGVEVIALGESHHGAHHEVFNEVFTRMDKFDGIFLEMPVNFQEEIDSFIKTGRFGEILERHIAGAAREGKEIREDLLLFREVAVMGKLPIVCIDSSKTKQGNYQQESNIGHYFLRGKSRDEDMYMVVKEKLSAVGGKWFLVSGLNHVNYGRNFRSGDITLGSRLKRDLGDRFYNIGLWKVTEEVDKNILSGEMEGFDVRETEPDRRLLELMRRNGWNVNDEKGELSFDAYIVHR